MISNINMKNFIKIVNEYSAQRYNMTTVPMLIDKKIVETTLPKDKQACMFNDQYAYVGSAEQSFLHLKAGKLATGKHMAMTSCYRDDAEDESHIRVFLKLELIHVLSPDVISSNSEVNRNLMSMIKKCSATFRDVCHSEEIFDNISVEFVGNNESQHDILLNGIEIGRYGIRDYLGKKYIYGTGVAEPRLSYALSKGVKINAK